MTAETLSPQKGSVHWITLSDTSGPGPTGGMGVHDTDAKVSCGANGSIAGAGTGDFNNDGDLDGIAILTYRNLGLTIFYNEVVIAVGDGKGGFSSSIMVAATSTSGSLSVATGDFNADGNLDLSVATTTTSTSTQILYGDGTGAFSTTPP